MQFTEFGFDDTIIEALGYMGFENATPIQEQTIPQTLAGKDVIGCAQTGTGKTAAFTLPILHLLSESRPKGIGCLIICPTRELAIQIDQAIQGFSYFVGLESLPIYGGGDGMNWEEQKKALIQGTDIVVATPGKLISHLNMGYVNFDTVQHLILDEADRMLDQGFHDDIMKIIEKLPKKRQTLLFSATMPPKIRTFCKKILNDPFEVTLALSKPAEGVLQAAYLAYNEQKVKLIRSLINDKPEYESIIIFSSTKRNVGEIVRNLRAAKFDVAGISSDLEQTAREEVLRKFRSKSIRIIVATDVLARGIDIKDINLVINYDVPNDAEDYVHRIGRTARASTTGVALTLINPDDMYNFSKIEELIEKQVPKVALPAELGEGPKWSTKPVQKHKKKNFHRKKKR